MSYDVPKMITDQGGQIKFFMPDMEYQRKKASIA
jgi:hypothetical protein